MNDIEKIVKVRNALFETTFEKGVIQGSLTLNKELIKIIKEFEGVCIEDIKDQEKKLYNIENASEGVNISFKLALSRYRNYFETFEDFIYKNQSSKPDGLFFIHDLNYFSNQYEVPEKIERYLNLLDFVNLLVQIADYKNEQADYLELIFIQSKRINFKIHYSINDLKKPLKNIQVLEGNFSDQTKYFQERISIFKNELISLLVKSDNPSKVFSFLLENWDNLFDNYLKSFEFYLEGFSFEKIKTELDNEKLELSKKLHDIIDGLGNKIIAIPIAYYLIIAQFDFKGTEIIKNFLLLAASFLFTFLINVLLNNQKKQLKIIAQHIGELNTRFSNHPEFKIVLNTLEEVKSNQNRKLLYFKISIWLIFIITITLFIYIQNEQILDLICRQT